MCDIAGYTGNRRAAPILIDMLRREEGYWGGYYTGIATIDGNKLYMRKVVGDLDRLLAETDALDLPGTTGIIHSRTPGTAGKEWGHPFVSCDRKLALAANGSRGVFDGVTDFSAGAAWLEGLGHQFASKDRNGSTAITCPRCPDGSFVHMTDIYCHVCEEYIRQGQTPLSALVNTLRSYPAEVVDVMIHADHPQKLFVARYSQPMMWGRCAGESFIATTAAAFPDREWTGIEPLPANAGVCITPDGCEMIGCVRDDIKVGRITAEVVENAYARIAGRIENSNEPVQFSELSAECRPLFKENELNQASFTAYQVLDSMVKAGKVRIVSVTVRGNTAELTAPSFRAVWTGD